MKVTIEIDWYSEKEPPTVSISGRTPDWFRWAWFDEMLGLMEKRAWEARTDDNRD